MAISKGIQTTEFALTLIVNIASIIASVSGLIPPSICLIVLAVVNAIYGILRTIVKIYDPAYVAPELPNTSVTK